MAHIRSDISTGRRLYIQTSYGEPIVAELKRIGVHWDADHKCWWISPTKKALVEEALVASDERKEAGIEPEKIAEDISKARVYAQVQYRGRKYYVIAEQRSQATATEAPRPIRCRLTTLDGLPPFWADCGECELVRTYEGREQWDGRRYSGKTITVYPTIGSLRRFRDRQKNPDTARVQCHECGSWHPAAERCTECGGA